MVSPYSSIRELSRAIRYQKVSSVELTKMYLARLKSLGREHNAIAELTEEHALKQAKKADNAKPMHALHGIPFGVKDLLATKGIPTRWGSPGHEDQVFDYDATAVQKLYEKGGVLVAKLEMIELAGGGNYNIAGASRGGPCLSAWDKKRWAGGSSSGSGACTALGCVGYSLGSETSGSITCPSSFNGCTGFRPTYGRVSRHGAMALSWTLDKIGPICRSAEDCAIVLNAISGYDPLDPSSLRDRLNLKNNDTKLRIGLLKETFKDSKAEVCEKGYQEALNVFKKLGHEIVEVSFPDLPYWLMIGIIVDAEGTSAHEEFIRSDRLQKLADINQVAGFAAGLETKAVDYLWAMRMRNEALKANAVWDQCDCVFTPSFYHPAVPADQPFDKTWVNMGGHGTPANLLGWPAICFPIAFEDGAPIGAEVIAPAFREDVCLRLAKEFQRNTDWHLKHP